MFPRSLALTGAALLVLGTAAVAHDSWINRGGFRNVAGEWCCGDGDCFVVPGEHVSITSSGYLLREIGEVGAFWRCRRHDGSRRCFFAPPPAT